MSKLAAYKALEAQLAKQLQQLDALKNDNELQQEIEFEKKLRKLMADYGVNLGDIVALLDPQSGSYRPKPADKRSERKVKVYKNPQTGDIIETKGGNHKTLKEWKAESGADVVESWLQN